MFRHGLVEGGIENSHLVGMGQQFFNSIYTQQVGWVVQRGQLGQLPDVILDTIVNQYTFLVIFTSLCHAVSYGLNLGK